MVGRALRREGPELEAMRETLSARREALRRAARQVLPERERAVLNLAVERGRRRALEAEGKRVARARLEVAAEADALRPVSSRERTESRQLADPVRDRSLRQEPAEREGREARLQKTQGRLRALEARERHLDERLGRLRPAPVVETALASGLRELGKRAIRRLSRLLKALGREGTGIRRDGLEKERLKRGKERGMEMERGADLGFDLGRRQREVERERGLDR
jgi:hypothetical protein